MERTGKTAALCNAVALCAVGAEKVVSNEIKKLGLAVLDSGFGKVRFQADTAGLYRALMALRAADRVLLEAGYFHAADFDALFEGALAVSWESVVPARLGLKVGKVRSNRSQLKAQSSIQAVVHKAAAQRLCEAAGLARLPEARAAAELRVYVEKDMVSLLVDLSGQPLFKRGYRPEGGVAPLRETTAAAMLLLSGWKRKYPLYDPFCGSGTILAEALIYAWDMAPGLGRRFAIDNLCIADDSIGEAVREELRGKVNFQRAIRIAGSDGDASAAALAKSNLERAQGLLNKLHPADEKSPSIGPLSANVFVEDITQRRKERKEEQGIFESADSICASVPLCDEFRDNDPRGFIVTNPPYGKRLGDKQESERIYAGMASLAEDFPGWKLAVITDHPGFESFFGRKADSCREITGGPIPAFFYQYERL